ncbi:MAG: collagen-binding domain-containing protein [Verrucomicrobiota bacterium]
MKIFPYSNRKNSGSILLVSLVLCGVLGTMLASFLYLTQAQVTSVSRSQTWNTAMVVTEAGLEEGLSMINRYANTSTPLTSWSLAAQANGWTDLGGGAFSLQRTLATNCYYIVYITNLAGAPVIKSVGYVCFPNTGTYLSRAVLSRNTAGSFFLGGVLAKKQVSINGSAVFDSYDSQDPNFSTAGQWDIHKRKNGGNVGSIQSNVVATIVDNGAAKIYGQIATGPNSTISMGGNASAGSIAWVDAGHKGIQPGWSRNDLNVSIPDAPPLPSASYLSLPSAGSRVLDASGRTAYYQATTTYQMNSKNYLLITNGTVVIDAQSGIKMNAQSSIQIAPGAKLILYLGTENTQLDGQGMVNNSGYATNCIVYGKNNCQQIEINGGSDFVGYVYAPYADITLNGNSDTSGAMVGNTFQINGNMGFHYDESLGGPQSGSSIFRGVSWQEVAP